MWLILALATIFWGTILAVLLIFDQGRWSYFAISKVWARSIIFLSRVRVRVEGLENIPEGPCIFMSNHQSYFDVICLIAYLPRPARFVAKRILKFIPIFGQLMWATGHIIIDRKNPKQAWAELDRAVEKIKKGTSVLIFPEGTRSPDHRLGEFKKGGFVLAIKSGVPIVPISITGTQSMMPKGKYSFKRPELIEIKIREPIYVQGYSMERKEELIEKARTAIIKGFSPNTPEAKVNQPELEQKAG